MPQNLSTRVNHPPRLKLKDWNLPSAQPIFQAAKFTVDSLEGWMQRSQDARQSGEELFLYSRISNPTIRELEMLLSDLQGREEALVVSSGMAAISAVLVALLSPGDEVFLFRESYQPSRTVVRSLLGKYGVKHRLFSITALDEVETALRAPLNVSDSGRASGRRILFFESPTNPICRVADIERLCSMAKSAGALTLLDNTFAGIHQHGDTQVDLMVHSLTKYAAGHGDVTAGAILGPKNLVAQIRETAILLGATLDPHAAFLIQRGLKTYALRYSAQCRGALEVARFLSKHPKVSKVFYPGLETDPGFALARKQMKEPGAVLSFELKNESANSFVARLKLFAFTVSLGATESLATPVLQLYGSDLTPEEARASDMTDRTVRVSVGVEDPADLIADLASALELAP
ncbi:MAG: trans-sulfuration enzyme family protein [Oligoflexia bacterium]